MDELARVHASLLLGQEPLGAEFEAIWDANVATLYETSPCPCQAPNCGGDHKPDNSGIDDGPLRFPPRKKAAPKQPQELAAIRARAWATRRLKYGACGHG
jgi:hypothetical protein